MISKKDLMQNRNSYNRDINKRIFLQEDIERLEGRIEELQDTRYNLEQDVNCLEKSKKILLTQQAIGYEGFDEDIKITQEDFLNKLRYTSESFDYYKEICEETGVEWESPKRFYAIAKTKEPNRYLGWDLEIHVDHIEKVIKEHPKITISTDIFLKQAGYDHEEIKNLTKELKESVIKKKREIEDYKKKKITVIDKQQEALEYKIKQTDALEEVYRKKIEDERKVSRMYIFAGFVLGAIFTSLFMM